MSSRRPWDRNRCLQVPGGQTLCGLLTQANISWGLCVEDTRSVAYGLVPAATKSHCAMGLEGPTLIQTLLKADLKLLN